MNYETNTYIEIQPVCVKTILALPQEEREEIKKMAIDAIMACKKYREVLQIPGKVGNYCVRYNAWTQMIWNTRKAPLITPIKQDGENLFPWQKQLWEIIKNHKEIGVIIWIYDKKGRSGKSKFCDWMYLYNDGFLAVGKGSDVKCQYDQEKYILFDFTRDDDEPNDWINYSLLEQWSNGRFNSGKYQPSTKGGEMVCIGFANICPNLKKLSQGRFIVYKLENNILTLMTHEDAQESFDTTDYEKKFEAKKKLLKLDKDVKDAVYGKSEDNLKISDKYNTLNEKFKSCWEKSVKQEREIERLKRSLNMKNIEIKKLKKRLGEKDFSDEENKSIKKNIEKKLTEDIIVEYIGKKL
jgi:hypothetical protein